MTLSTACSHEDVICLNEYEIIRKYRCVACQAVMMCECDSKRGMRFLPHQLDEGVELQTQRRVPVTHGFLPKICRECRGLPLVPAPKTAMPGSTSKIRRIYWREIMFREFELLAELGVSPDAYYIPGNDDLHKQIEKRAVEDIKALHEKRPKYSLGTESEALFLARIQPTINELHAESQPGGFVLCSDGRYDRPEIFAGEWLGRQGYIVVTCESRPFHALFSVLLCPLIQDESDSLVRETEFGSRDLGETHPHGSRAPTMISMMWPEDFGTPGYAARRADKIKEFFAHTLPVTRVGLLEFFDAHIHASYEMRQYLWVTDDETLQRATQLLYALEPEAVHRILRYLVGDYWGRYCGWPDLFAQNDSAYLFAEVKLSKDKLSDEQRTWIENNQTQLNLPFQIIKIHRTQSARE